MNGSFTIVDFYLQCVMFFESIISSGKNVWTLFTTKMSVLIQGLPSSWFTSFISWAIENLGDYSIIEIGLGAGINIFIVIWLIKFINVL